MEPITVFAAATALAIWLQSPPPDRVVLLPGPDGQSSGAVVIKSKAGEQLLNTSYAAADVNANGVITPRQEDVASVKTRYGAALGAQPPRPVSYTVYFVSGSAVDLTPESLPVLEQLKAELTRRPAPEITVIGHTDRVGKLEDNDALSLKRAATVKDVLTAAGIQALGVDVAGRGEREPLVPTADEVAEAKNRRVEINVR